MDLSNLEKAIKERCDELIAKAEARGKPKQASSGRFRKGKILVNTLKPVFQRLVFEEDEKWPGWLDDVLSGITRLDWYRIPPKSEAMGPSGTILDFSIAPNVPLSKHKIVKIFTWLDIIDSQRVGELLRMDERHARRYAKAARLAFPYLVKSVPAYLLERREDELGDWASGDGLFEEEAI